MTPEQLVPSRETCERLKEAGWAADTYFAWVPRWVDTGDGWAVLKSEADSIEGECAAPTLAELIAELHPSKVGCSPPKRRWEQTMWGDGNGYWWHDEEPGCGHGFGCSGHANAAEAAAKLWLALREVRS